MIPASVRSLQPPIPRPISGIGQSLLFMLRSRQLGETNLISGQYGEQALYIYCILQLNIFPGKPDPVTNCSVHNQACQLASRWGVPEQRYSNRNTDSVKYVEVVFSITFSKIY